MAPLNLNHEYGFSNTGVGNAGPNALPNALNSVTSNNGGGNAAKAFAAARSTTTVSSGDWCPPAATTSGTTRSLFRAPWS